MEEYVIQRRFPRYRTTLPVLYKSTPGSGSVGAGWTRDLSEGGSCVELDERLWPGTPLQLRLHTDRGSIELKAQVAWSGQPNPDGGNIHGVTFIQVPAPLRQALRDLLRTKEHSREAGMRLVDAEPRTGARGRLVAFVHPSSVHGLLVELVQERR